MSTKAHRRTFGKRLWRAFEIFMVVFSLASVSENTKIWQDWLVSIGAYLDKYDFPESLTNTIISIYEVYRSFVGMFLGWIPEPFDHGVVIFGILFGRSVFITLAQWAAYLHKQLLRVYNLRTHRSGKKIFRRIRTQYDERNAHKAHRKRRFIGKWTSQLEYSAGKLGWTLKEIRSRLPLDGFSTLPRLERISTASFKWPIWPYILTLLFLVTVMHANERKYYYLPFELIYWTTFLQIFVQPTLIFRRWENYPTLKKLSAGVPVALLMAWSLISLFVILTILFLPGTDHFVFLLWTSEIFVLLMVIARTAYVLTEDSGS